MIPKPACSVVDDPRPVPKSKRPPDRWSSIATRSAMRAGWFTGGVMLKIPEPMCNRSVRAPTHGSSTSLAEMWEYSSRKWCSVVHQYFQFVLSASSASATSLMSRSCSATEGSSCPHKPGGTNPPQNNPNSIASLPSS